jgi:hypothetical protein
VWYSLVDDEFIHFNAGTHTEVLRMRFEDFRRLVEPRICRLARPLSDRPPP